MTEFPKTPDYKLHYEKVPFEVPESWVCTRLEDLASPNQNSLADGPFGSNLKTEHYTLTPEVRIIQLSNIGETGWRNENKKYTTFAHAETIMRSKVSPGDIVIAKMMPAGRAIEVPDIEKNYVISSDAIKFVPSGHVDKQFLLYAINSSYVNTQILDEVQGIGRVRTSLGKVKKCYIPLPPLAEQHRIVAVIESSFAVIDEIERNKDDLKTVVTTVKQKILSLAICGKLVPQDSNDEPASVLLKRIHAEREELIKDGKIRHNKNDTTITRSDDNSYYENLPVGWVSIPIERLFSVIGGGTPSTKNTEYWGEGIPWFSSADIDENGKITPRRFVTQQGINSSTSNVVPEGSVVVVTRVGLGKVAILNESMCFSQDNQALIPHYPETVYNRYLYHFLIYKMQSLKYSGRGTTISGITKKQLTDIFLLLPPIEEQKRIVTTIESAYEQFDNISENLS